MEYIKNIVAGVATIFEGLTITASHLFRRPITVQYPDKLPAPLTESLAPRFRGLLAVDMDICIACSLCEKSCPIQCIDAEITKPPERLITKFNIDLGKCMYCGLCTEACPTQAIHFTKEFEGASYNINDLTHRFVEEGRPVTPYKKGT
jgi:NADH-quinone oxidoreductase chain I